MQTDPRIKTNMHTSKREKSKNEYLKTFRKYLEMCPEIPQNYSRFGHLSTKQVRIQYMNAETFKTGSGTRNKRK